MDVLSAASTLDLSPDVQFPWRCCSISKFCFRKAILEDADVGALNRKSEKGHP